jgi:Carbohydrate family 9 binding domain-like
VVNAPNASLELTVKPTAADAGNPSEFAARVREKLTDDKRLVRIYGSYNVLARLEGDGKRARLHLLNYGRQPAREVRVRVLGKWVSASPREKDVEPTGDAIEFTVPDFETYVAVDLGLVRVMESLRAPSDFELSADPTLAQWRDVPPVTIGLDYFGKAVAGSPTEVRSRWTAQNLYLLYSAPYDELNLKPQPQKEKDTVPLWDWDVVEAFLGSNFEHIGHYFEFELSPQGEWVDLDIDKDHPKQQQFAAWNSGFAVRARIDAAHKVWFGEMRIPLRSLGVSAPRAGQQLRTGLYRCAGRAPQRAYYAWSPTGQRSFHVPEAFGLLVLR